MPRDEGALEPPVRIRAHLWLRLIALALTAAAGGFAAAMLAAQSDRSVAAVGLTLLCGLVAVVAWWGEVAIDRQRLAVRVLPRDGNQLLAIERVRIVGLNPGRWWRGGPTLIVQDATGRTVALGQAYFPLRRVWRELQPLLATNPEVVVHPSVNALARPPWPSRSRQRPEVGEHL